jgi:hypothetical protein
MINGLRFGHPERQTSVLGTADHLRAPLPAEPPGTSCASTTSWWRWRLTSSPPRLPRSGLVWTSRRCRSWSAGLGRSRTARGRGAGPESTPGLQGNGKAVPICSSWAAPVCFEALGINCARLGCGRPAGAAGHARRQRQGGRSGSSPPVDKSLRVGLLCRTPVLALGS